MPRYLILTAVLVFLFVVRGILVPFVIAAVFAFIFSGVIDRIEKRLPLPRVAAVALFFVVLFLPLAVILVAVAPRLLEETVALVGGAPDIITSILVQLFGSDVVVLFGQEMAVRDISAQIVSSLLVFLGQPAEAIYIAGVILRTILYTVLSLVLLFYFLLDRERFGEALLLLLPGHVRDDVRKTMAKIHVALSQYLRGLMFLVLLMSTVTWLGLTFLFQLPYALPIALATGFLEVIPLIGPIAAGAIAVIVGLEYAGISTAVWIGIFYYVVRQAEDQFVAPYVLGRAVALHPVVAIFAVLAGGLLAGVLGMALAIPAAAAIKVIFDNWQLND